LLALDPPIVPMTLGSEYPWTLGLLFVDDLLIALMGAEAYTAYFSGQYTSGDDQKLREMLTHAGRLWRYMPKQSGKRPNEISWQEGINHFIAGEVAMTFMGDWAKPLLDNAGMIPGLDYEQLPFPGTLGTFVVSVDALAMPIDAPSRRLAVGFLKTARSEEGQVAFNVLGSIPVRRLGPDAAGYFDVAATRTLEEFWAAGTKCPLGWHALVPELYADLVSLALHDFTVSCAAGEGTGADTCDPEPAMATFIGNYDRLRVTQ
jgi:glucose/mannose transport system substrate-binding protein